MVDELAELQQKHQDLIELWRNYEEAYAAVVAAHNELTMALAPNLEEGHSTSGPDLAIMMDFQDWPDPITTLTGGKTLMRRRDAP